MTQLTPVERYRAEVLPPAKADDLWRSLPAHIKPAVFERNLMNALMQNPDLMRFQPHLVYREVSKAAGLGLLLDPQLGEAYMVVAYNYKTKQQEPQLRVGYKGVIKLARQAGNVEAIYAHEVCERDKIICHMGTDKKLVHEPVLFGDRGKVIGYYAVIKYQDGAFDFEPMSLSQVHAIRDRSDAWKAFSEGKIKSTPWSTDNDEMAKKTVLRRLLKRQPQSGELMSAIGIEDEAEFPEMRTVSQQPRHTGADAGPPMPPAIGKATVPPANEIDNGGDHADLDPPVHRDARGNAIVEATAEDVFDGAGWLRDLRGALAGCETYDDVTEARERIFQPAKDSAAPSDWKAGMKAVKDAYDRLDAADDEDGAPTMKLKLAAAQ